MATLFISDLHLHPSRPEIIDTFCRFLREEAGGTEALYILGDLFDAWIGDDHVEPAFEPVLHAMQTCTDAGTPVFLMHGNRDFLIGERFAETTGCTLIPDPLRIDLQGTPTLLMHGDTLCTDDHDYQALRKTVRDPVWQKQVLALPARERIELARQARELSILATGQKEEYIMDVNRNEVERVMREHDVLRLIHGHTHRPGRHALIVDGTHRERIVLGDWYRSRNCLAL